MADFFTASDEKKPPVTSYFNCFDYLLFIC